MISVAVECLCDFLHELYKYEICKFLDEMAVSEDKNVVDLLGAGFFEAVISDKKPIVEKLLKTLNALLHEDAKRVLKQVAE